MSCSEECKHPCYDCEHNAVKETIRSIHDEVANECHERGAKEENARCIRILNEIIEHEKAFRSESSTWDLGVIHGLDKAVKAIKRGGA